MTNGVAQHMGVDVLSQGFSWHSRIPQAVRFCSILRLKDFGPYPTGMAENGSYRMSDFRQLLGFRIPV